MQRVLLPPNRAIIAGLKRRAELPHASPTDQGPDRAQQDLDVQSQGEVFEIKQVVSELDPGLGQIRRIGSAHLRPAGDAGSHQLTIGEGGSP